MRRFAVGLTAFLLLLGAATPPRAAAQLPPHAWLFGAWTGGLFPPPTQMTAAACLAQPVVIFTRDLVLRSTLTELTYVQREVATARATPAGVDFRFTPLAEPAGGGGPLGLSGMGRTIGFGCADPDELHVQRQTENAITLPGCTDFPYPLVRCPAR